MSDGRQRRQLRLQTKQIHGRAYESCKYTLNYKVNGDQFRIVVNIALATFWLVNATGVQGQACTRFIVFQKKVSYLIAK